MATSRWERSSSNAEEYDYNGTGPLTGQLHYYALAGHLIGSYDGTNTTYYLTDAQGSVLTSFSQSAVTGEQIYGPYGNTRYTAGTIDTAKGYTGQIQDSVTGLDYYNARYYDPVSGLFLSADNVQGNAQGADPYSYVAGNPETKTDPTGNKYECNPEGSGCGGSGGPTAGNPDPGPGSGGCEKGYHLTNSGCVKDGGCHGSGGKNGESAMGCTTSGSPPGKKPTLSDSCDGNLICDAQSDANKASNVFWGISVGLSFIALLAEGLALGLEALAALDLGSFWLAWIAPILSGLAMAFQALAETASATSLLAALVATEFGYKGASTKPSDWSRDAMSSFKSVVDKTIIIGGVAIAAYLGIRGIVRDIIKGIPGFFLSKGVAAGLMRFTGGGLGVATGLLPLQNMQGFADSYIAQMESDVSPAW